ncbi:MAG TPA: helix-turn-helix transcriptional regulator [Gemmatimonadaceae bacterium]|nr:helix-turn-helix transcriptional regulator [Gemmatimonadaceae bacterium]
MESILRNIQRACTAGLDSVTLRRELVQRIASDVPVDAYAFSICDPDTGLMAHTVAQGIPPTLGRAYVERLYPTECATIAVTMSRRGAAVFSMLDKSPAARRTFGNHGIESHIHSTFVLDGRLWGTWCMMREHKSPHDARSMALLRRAGPWIARGLKSASLVDQALVAQERKDIAESGSTSPGVVVLDGRNRPLVRTALAKRWLADLADSGVGDADDVPLSVLGIATRLRRTPSDLPQEVVLRLRGASGQWYVLRGSLAESDASAASAVVVVVRPAVRREIAPMLTHLYALSEREREVVAAVARGEPTKCIAAALGVSPHTIEEHLERACRKIGVRGRKALVAKLFVDGYAPTVTAPSPAKTPAAIARTISASRENRATP